MSTTKTFKVNQNISRQLKCRAVGYYDYTNIVTPTKENSDINVEMQKYDGLKYTFNTQGGKGTSIIDFSDTVLPWKFEMNNYLARTRYCAKPYREEPYQVEILKQVPSNYNIVGTPMINDNIVSGFSSSNYLTLNNSLVSKNNATYVFKVTFPSSMSASQCIFEQDYFANIEFRGNTQDLRAWNWQTSQYEKIMDITFGKTYWFKMVINGSVKTYSYSEDGIDYTTAYTMNDNGTNTTTGNFYIGITSRLGNIFQGSIDLSECYVLIDGTKYNLSDTTYVLDLIRNYTVNGTPTINEGIVSGFSSSNYLTLNEPFKPEGAWEIVLKLKRSENGQQFLLGSIGSWYKTFGGELRANNTLGFGLTSNGYSWDIAWFGGNVVLEENVWYWVKLSFTGSEYKYELSTNGSDYELVDSVTSSTPIYRGDDSIMNIGIQGDRYKYWHGSIDLNESYVEYNGNKTYLSEKVIEELYGAFDGNATISKPLYCYANKDQSVILRNTKNITMDTTDWYLGEIKFFDVDIELQPDLDV